MAEDIETESRKSLVAQLKEGVSEALEWFSTADFYIELLTIGITITVACLLAMLIKRRVTRFIDHNPPKKFDRRLFTKPLKLLASAFSILLLSVILPLAQQYSGGKFVDASIKLATAWFFARFFWLYVRSTIVSSLLAFLIMAITVLSVTGLLSTTTGYLENISFAIGSSFSFSLYTALKGVVMLVVVFWLAGGISRTLEGYLRRSSNLNYNTRELIVTFFRIFVYFVAFLITLSAIGVDLTVFAVFGGALGVGIGLGLQKITSNFVSGITLLMEKSIKIGDLIEVNNIQGWVRQLNIRYTLIECFDGREVLIPNEDLASMQVNNWTYSNFRARIEFTVGVAYDTDLKLAQKLILEAATEHTLCLKDPEPNCFLREFADSSINFLLVFWVGDVRDGRYKPQSEVMFAIKDKFDAHGIEIPFPQRVVYMKNTAKEK